MASKEIDNNTPPEGQNLVKDILCPQLLLAILAGSAFAYTLVKPIDSKNITLPMGGPPKSATLSNQSDPAIDNAKLAAEVDKQTPLALYNAGKKDAAIKAAWVVAKDVQSRKDIKKLLAAGSVLIKSTELKDKWKGWLLLDKALHSMPRARFVKAYYANRQFEFGKMHDAIESYEDAIKLGPDDWVEPRLRLGELCIKDEQGAKAVRTLEEALAIKPKDPRLIERLGIAIAISGDSDGGYKKFTEGATLEQDSMDYHPDIRKLVDKNGGLIELAITEQRKDVEAHPDDVEAKIKLARLLNIVSRLDQAQKELEAAREKKPSDPEISFVLADVLHRRHDEKEAASAFAQGCRDETADKPAAPSEQKYLPTYEDGLEEEKLNKDEAATPATPAAAETKSADDEKPAADAATEKSEDKPKAVQPSTKSPDEE